jgi:3-hydroxyisobutyrate dehydrogenase-like beta-hydroxyacid dehydrogenase
MELSTMVDVIKASSGNTWITEEWEQAQQFLRFVLQDPAQLDALVKTGLKDMQLAASFCAASGIDAPLLGRAIQSLEQHGVDGMRANLAAVLKAL